MELIAAIDAYFETLERESRYHNCLCAGCSAEKRALREVLQALRDQAAWKQRSNGTNWGPETE